jgi:hypothetical protein
MLIPHEMREKHLKTNQIIRFFVASLLRMTVKIIFLSTQLEYYFLKDKCPYLSSIIFLTCMKEMPCSAVFDVTNL